MFELLQSGSAKFPTQMNLLQHMLAELVSEQKSEWFTAKSKNEAHWIQVAQAGETLILNLSFPFKEDCTALFAKHSLPIPENWEITGFKQKGFFTAGNLEFSLSINTKEQIAGFVHQLFLTVYGESPDYILTGEFN